MFIQIFKSNNAQRMGVEMWVRWMIIRWFERCNCRFCDGTLLGIVCKDGMFFITEFVREWGMLFVKLQMIVYTDCGTYVFYH
jgi:hypothetical protein